MMDLFGRKPVDDPEVVARLKEWARELLGLDEDVVVTVAELRCAEDDCPDVETVIGILEAGSPRKFKVFKPLGEVTRKDVEAMVAQQGKDYEGGR
jgi:hypothetical protein